MKVLVVDAFSPDGPDKALVHEAIATLRGSGHEVEHRPLVGGPFEVFMSAEERREYHGAEPLITDETIDHAQALKAAAALLFCYPTTLFTVPSILKGWIERVLVPGVAFVFDAKERVRPGLTNIRRLGVVTTTPHDPQQTRRARDAGRRTILWNLRLSCHKLCRRTFVLVPAGSADVTQMRRALGRW